LVVYVDVHVDDFKMAGPSANLEKAWASIKAAVNIGHPEPYLGLYAPGV